MSLQRLLGRLALTGPDRGGRGGTVTHIYYVFVEENITFGSPRERQAVERALPICQSVEVFLKKIIRENISTRGPNSAWSKR